ncbi:hypothetical protein NUW54_g9922 [Trametes sanguinea]|uniref:Uncharacterized protein n=1 Tax=Trametes sanguinea TaxID=158606 RepID=A0ACC1P2M2_9APHY|nr:hypothetical protein NUW54_g9922 [Trametes sanguinea]
MAVALLVQVYKEVDSEHCPPIADRPSSAAASALSISYAASSSAQGSVFLPHLPISTLQTPTAHSNTLLALALFRHRVHPLPLPLASRHLLHITACLRRLGTFPPSPTLLRRLSSSAAVPRPRARCFQAAHPTTSAAASTHAASTVVVSSSPSLVAEPSTTPAANAASSAAASRPSCKAGSRRRRSLESSGKLRRHHARNAEAAAHRGASF